MTVDILGVLFLSASLCRCRSGSLSLARVDTNSCKVRMEPLAHAWFHVHEEASYYETRMVANDKYGAFPPTLLHTDNTRYPSRASNLLHSIHLKDYKYI